MAYRMTPARKAALRKAQMASARKRRSMKTKIKRKGRKLVRKARKNAQPAARKTLTAASKVGGYMMTRRLVGPQLANTLYAGAILNKAAQGGYAPKKRKTTRKKR